ncbi:CBL-interacting serine/threonine-protein kinase 23 [Camellia lanceoleosa]|uniref:CBL-interacting serine/threonine-protein kinase 23 n=1 Tax=Camellia lanceoleosa TaxID=1840588 RepID=A0ACC0F2C1_9ERIC|nr:CBL-interacting serine/threonine-protein kinase 23 [Camellia lanceoleosa]
MICKYQCITIAEVIENEWFKKGYKPLVFENEDASLNDVGAIFNESKIYEVAPSLCMVELRKAGEDTLEFHKFYKNFATGLKDIVWKSGDETKEEANDGFKIGLRM